MRDGNISALLTELYSTTYTYDPNHTGILQNAIDTKQITYLDLFQGASDLSQIKRRYRDIVLKIHPDKTNQDDRLFKLINEAYTQLVVSQPETPDSAEKEAPLALTTNFKEKYLGWAGYTGNFRIAADYIDNLKSTYAAKLVTPESLQREVQENGIPFQFLFAPNLHFPLSQLPLELFSWYLDAITNYLPEIFDHIGHVVRTCVYFGPNCPDRYQKNLEQYGTIFLEKILFLIPKLMKNFDDFLTMSDCLNTPAHILIFLQNLGPHFINENLPIKGDQLSQLVGVLTPIYFAVIFDYFRPIIEKLDVANLPMLLFALNNTGSFMKTGRGKVVRLKNEFVEMEWHPELMKKTIVCLQEKILTFFENTSDASENTGALVVSQRNTLPSSMSRLTALVPFWRQTTAPTETHNSYRAITRFLDIIGNKSFTFLIQTVPEIFRRLLTLPIDATLFIKKLDTPLLVADQSTLQNIACMITAHLIQHFNKNFQYSSTVTSAMHFLSGAQAGDRRLMNTFKTILDSSQENSEKCTALLDDYHAEKTSISADLIKLFEKYSLLLLLDKIIKPNKEERSEPPQKYYRKELLEM